MPSINWIKIEGSGLVKINFHTIKKIVYGFLAGFFIGIGFSAMLIIKGSSTIDNSAINNFLGSTIFCVGILMCMFVGASLFTANCAIYAGVLTHKIPRKLFYLDLLITFVSNYLGAILIALMVYGTGIIDGVKDYAVSVATAKIDAAWWKTLLSGVLTNVLVVACVICMTIWDHKIIGFLGTLIMITAFAICGFQHVVANQFITTLGGLYGAFNGNGKLVGELFYNCLLCSGLGNFLGGGWINSFILISFM